MSYQYNNTVLLKMVLIGDTNVGKTSIINQYIYKKYNNYSESTIGAAFYSREYDFLYSTMEYKLYDSKTDPTDKNKIKIKLAIWDTAGQERYNSLVPMYYRGAQIIIVVTSATPELIYSPHKLTNRLINNLPDDIFSSIDPSAVKYLVYNKCDLLETDIYDKQSDTENTHNIKTRYVSACDNVNIDKLVLGAITDYTNENLQNILSRDVSTPSVDLINTRHNNKCC